MSLLKNVPILKRMIELGYTMLLIIILSTITGLILAFPVMWLWNFVFESILHINVFQAWALNVLTGILFGYKSAPKND
ncbi:MAG: hypothetical protein ABIJ08_06630 [Nanoarchaeota archaeon]